MAFVVLLGACGFYRYTVTPAPNSNAEMVSIAPGESFSGIARRLARRGLVRYPRALIALAALRGDHRRIKAGEFEIPPRVTPAGLLDALVAGRVLNHPVTVIEGWTLRQLRQHLATVSHLDTVTTGWTDAELMAALGAPDLPAEGQFLPETYHQPRGTTDLELLARAKQALDRVLQQEWLGRAADVALESPAEALILASIVQKETGPGEEAAIAGVFHRRLRIGMRLQADPTVIYGLADMFDGNLRRRDLRRDTPYNTYTRQGLPPTPIALAGRRAIHAVLHPEQGEALYFVARKDGLHHFSADLSGHQAAVRRYQLAGDDTR